MSSWPTETRDTANLRCTEWIWDRNPDLMPSCFKASFQTEFMEKSLKGQQNIFKVDFKYFLTFHMLHRKKFKNNFLMLETKTSYWAMLS